MSATRFLWVVTICALLLLLAVPQLGCTPTEPPAEPATETPGPSDAEPAETPATVPAGEGEQPAGEAPEVPLGLEPVPVPEDNPMTPEKVELGKLLFFDTRLSKDGTISCATCHDPQMAWTEHDPTSTGIDDQVGGRNSPTVINAAYATAQFWDGRVASLEEQALGPIENPIEMGHDLDVLVKGLTDVPEYRRRFEKVFGGSVTKEGVAKAIAAFERTILSGDSPYDRFTAGDDGALDEAQKRGLDLFGKARCSICHSLPMFSNYRYYNAGVGLDKDPPDKGRQEATEVAQDMGKFRVPSLREVANTGPYFHDGSVATLEDAVALMAAGGNDNPNLAGMLVSVRNANLTEQDQKDLVEFLKALSGKYPIIEAPDLP